MTRILITCVHVCSCLYTRIYILWDVKKVYVHTIKVNPKFVLETKWRYQISTPESQNVGVECWNWLLWLERPCFRAWGLVPKIMCWNSSVKRTRCILLSYESSPQWIHLWRNSTSCVSILEECSSSCGKVCSSFRFKPDGTPSPPPAGLWLSFPHPV